MHEINGGEPLAIKPWPDTGKLLKIGRQSVYDGIASGQIPSVRIGGRILVPLAGLKRMLAGEAK
jgi:excisionase family DNA binding protein